MKSILTGAIMMNIPTLASLIDWGWLRIGPPYIYINIDPVIFRLGALAVRWYGLMYVVGIMMGLLAIRGYTARKGITQDMVYRILWWCIAAGLIGGRLYFVIQQPDLVQGYLLQPWRILATWEGGMAFYGAIFLVIATLFWRARVERLNPLVLVDAGVLFAAAGQIFGRIGNLINGDIIGYPSTLPWSTVYIHPNSWACPNPATCGVPVQPAAGYELLTNIVVLVLLFSLARRVTRPGILMLVYLYCYTISQFLLFFVRDNVVVSFLGLNWGLKQAQWTSLILFLLLIPITYWVLRTSKPVPEGEVAVTYRIPQRPGKTPTSELKVLDGELVTAENGQIKHLEHDEVVNAQDTPEPMSVINEEEENTVSSSSLITEEEPIADVPAPSPKKRKAKNVSTSSSLADISQVEDVPLSTSSNRKRKTKDVLVSTKENDVREDTEGVE